MSWMTQPCGQRPALEYCRIGWSIMRMYSGFKLMKTGQVWKIKSTVLRLPSLEISFR